MEYKDEYLQLAKTAKTLEELAKEIGTTEQQIVTWAIAFKGEKLLREDFFNAVRQLRFDDKPKEVDLTFKQRKWLEVYLALGDATEAAMQAYDCSTRHSASQIGYENLRKLDYEEFLEVAGITDVLLQQKILEGLDANRTVSAKIINKGADSQDDDFVDVPDFMARHKYLETALKLKKRLVERKELTGKDGEALIPHPIYNGRSTDTV